MSYAEYDKRRRTSDGAIRLDNGKFGFVDLRAQQTVEHRPGSGWPRESESMGVMPHQVKKAMEVDRSLGVPTDYSEKAFPIFTSQGHQDRWVKANKAIDYGR